MNKNTILNKQSEYIYNNLKKDLDGKHSLNDYHRAISKSLNDFINIAFKPSFEAQKSNIFNKQEQEKELSQITLDLNVINDSLTYINDTILNNFNDMQIFKSKCKNLLNATKNSLSTLDFLNRNKNFIIFKEDFNSYDNIDLNKTNIENINVLTSEGVLTLPYIKSDSVALSNPILNLSSNAELGNMGVVEKIPYSENYYFLNDINKRDDILAINDGNETTWLEIQGYKNDDKDGITCQVSYSLTDDTYINWINIDPYIPYNSGYSLMVDKIEYRTDRSSVYKILWTNNDDNEIGLSYATEIKNKYTQQGVYIFETTKMSDLRITFRQKNPYKESIGSFKYKYITTDNRGNESSIDKSRDWAIKKITTIEDTNTEGYHIISDKEKIQKELQVSNYVDRWCIGIRDIRAYNRDYSTYTEVYSIKYTSDKPLKNLKLRTKELLVNSLKGTNPISYYISFDDIEWHQIKPENYFGDNNVPYYFNFTDATEESVQLYNNNIKYINRQINQVRLKIVMSIPERTENGDSPILQEYSLICEV